MFRRTEFQFPGLSEPIRLRLHDEEEHVSVKMQRVDIWEPTETNLTMALLREGDFFVDVGANVGYYSLLAQQLVGESGMKLALEPDIRNFALLETNLAEAGVRNLVLLNAAAGDHRGALHMYPSSTNFGDHRTYPGESRSCGHTVDLYRLDSLIAEIGQRPRLVKIDCQGAESSIFRGLENLWSNDALRPAALITEFWPHGLTLAGTDIGEFIHHIWSLGYEVWDIGRWQGQPQLRSAAELLEETRGFLRPEDQLFTNLCLLDRTQIPDLVPSEVCR